MMFPHPSTGRVPLGLPTFKFNDLGLGVPSPSIRQTQSLLEPRTIHESFTSRTYVPTYLRTKCFVPQSGETRSQRGRQYYGGRGSTRLLIYSIAFVLRGIGIRSK